MAKHRLYRLTAGLFALTAFSATLTETAKASPQPDFQCKVLPHPLLQGDGFLLGENIYFMGDDRVGLVGFADLPEQLPRVVSGSGEQFSNGAITFGAKGDEGFLELRDGTVFPCSAVNASAQSVPQTPQTNGGQGAQELALALGTIVRGGPDRTAARIEKLPDNEPVTLMRETGVYFDGFQWFEIEYSEGQRGFAWGGTLCVDTEMSGILIDCRRYAGVTARQALTGEGSSQGGSEPVSTIYGRSLFGSIIRNSPSAQGRKIDSIPQGTAVEFIGETGSFFDGWQWVRVRYGNGIEGFVWGGTVCVTQGSAPVGVHQTCG
jgi:hypothetical protein